MRYRTSALRASLADEGGWRRATWFLLLLLVALTVTACTASSGSEQREGTSPTTASSTGASSTTGDAQAAAKAAVVAAYRVWLSDVIAANRDPVGAYGRLDDHMSGDALKTMQVYIIDRRHRGLVARGTVRVGTPEVVSLQDRHAQVQGCVDATHFPDYQGGKLVPNSAGTVRLYLVTMANLGGWKVTSFSTKESTCVA